MIEETHLPPQTLKPGVQFDRCFATKMCTMEEKQGYDDVDSLYVKVHKPGCPKKLDVSEIFVKHLFQDNEGGDSLGGFLCSTVRKDGSFLHAFCTLAVDGILAKDLHVKNKNILVQLNDKQVLGSFEYDHDRVIETFKSLPMETAIKMEIYDRESQELKTIEFTLEGIREEVIVKEESVQLMVSPPSVNALEFQRQTKFFIHENGRLSFQTVANHKRDCKSHFVVRKKIDEKSWCQVYSFQLEKIPSRYLGFNGTTFDFIDSNETNAPVFKRVEKKGEYFLSPSCTSGCFGSSDFRRDFKGKFLYYDTAKEMFVLAPTQEVLTKEGYGLAMRETQCRA
ncbi:uncharacterized protein LOC111132824 isoform X2 [Crassostrea virginica]